jgi:hypothetical protein
MELPILSEISGMPEAREAFFYFLEGNASFVRDLIVHQPPRVFVQLVEECREAVRLLHFLCADVASANFVAKFFLESVSLFPQIDVDARGELRFSLLRHVKVSGLREKRD